MNINDKFLGEDFIFEETSPTPEELFNSQVAQKKLKIKMAKKRFQQQSVEYNSRYYFGGIQSARKYKDTLDLATLSGQTEVTIKTEEGLITLGLEELQNAIIAIAQQSYLGWYKEQEYLEEISRAQSEEDLNNIEWED